MEQYQIHLTARLKEYILSQQMKNTNHLELQIEKQDLPTLCKKLVQGGGRLVTMVGADEREICKHFALYYVFAFDHIHGFVTLQALVDEKDPTYPSVTPYLDTCDWYEREVHDLFGIKPVGHPNLIPLILHQDWPEGNYPLRKDYPVDLKQQEERSQNWFSTSYEGQGVTEVPVGPIHAGIIEPGHFKFGIAGDHILHLDAQLFFKHRGLEKRSEGMKLEEALLLSERICGVCALSHALSYAQAVENIAQVDIPLRAQYLRTLYLELERLYNHIGDVGNVCAGAGFHFGTSHGARLKERLQQLNEQITGHRFLRGVVAIGGLRHDIGKHELAFIYSTLKEVKQDFRELVNILLDHEITLDRMKTTGVLGKETANRMEVVGPAARASNREIDLRKSHPYLAYNELKFDVPTYMEGDVLARIRMRIDEAFESFKIIQQIIEKIKSGPIITEVNNIPAYKWGIGWTESPRGENIHWLMTGPENTVYRYRVRSASYSNWPAVPTAVKGNIVPDFPIINKSFELCYACCDR